MKHESPRPKGLSTSVPNTNDTPEWPLFGSAEHRARIARRLAANQRFKSAIADFLSLGEHEHRRRARELAS